MKTALHLLLAATCVSYAQSWSAGGFSASASLPFTRTSTSTLSSLSAASPFPQSSTSPTANTPPSPQFVLPPLPYPYNALEPQIDELTMTIHHTKHHQTYVTNLNNLYKGPKTSLLDLQKEVLTHGNPVRNNAGGVYNHGFFWKIMEPSTINTPASAALLGAINSSFGSMEEMKKKFDALAAPGATFGSGWVWLCYNLQSAKLEIVGTANQDNPLMLNIPTSSGPNLSQRLPVLGLDLWEHAYYLKYQNRRPEYVTGWWDVVNWGTVSGFFEDVKSGRGVDVEAL